MHHFDQGRRSAAEKVMAQESHRVTTHTGRKIGSVCCGAVAGTSVHAPMT